MKIRCLAFVIALCGAFALQAQNPIAPKDKQALRVMTYNVRNCRGMDEKIDYQRVANIIKRVNPDMAAIQELDSASKRNDGVFALKELAKRSKMHYTYAPAIDFQGGKYGIGILSKQKPLRYWTMPLPGREEQRVFLFTEFDNYVLCCAHFSLTAEDQVASVPLIFDALKDVHKPLFFAGDMNSVQGSPTQNALQQKFFALNDYHNNTIPGQNPTECIDFIYGFDNGNSYSVLKQQVLYDEPMASDHLPVFVDVKVNDTELLSSNQPNSVQMALMKRGYGMFMHFGVNTFGDTEWSDGTIPAGKYNPTNLDCDQWVRVARDAGFRYVLLITKHHDGFCLWDSKYTDYDVASSPVKTDVVKAVSEACKKYGLQFAIYYSLWDRHEASYKDKDFNKYISYMSNQLTELLTNYGPICELWFDGGWDKKPEEWQMPKIYALVKRLQPQCAVGVNHTIVLKEGERNFALPDSMTVDNKYAFQYFPSDFRLWDPKIAHKADKKQYMHQGKSYYLPFEHTICLSKAWNWFQKKNPLPARDLDELQELFYWCTDNHNTLVVNVPPDQTGRIREHEANTIIELGKRLGIKKDEPLPVNGQFLSIGAETKASSVLKGDNGLYGAQLATDGGMQTRWSAADTCATLTIALPGDKSFNKISIFECCDMKNAPDGFSNIRTNRIQTYQIEIWKDNQWLPVFVSDEPMGDCKVIRLLHSYQTSQIRLNITKASAPPSIYEFNVIDEK